MECTIEKVGQQTLLTVNHASFNATNGNEFRNDFDAIIEPGSQVVLDLGFVESIDSAGLAALTACLKWLRRTGGDAKLCNVGNGIRGSIDVMRMHHLVEIHPSAADALND